MTNFVATPSSTQGACSHHRPRGLSEAMANDYFSFRQFTVWQDHCAMKVGTDGTLLGAWAAGGHAILDVGTGTGLIALMMAQRFPDARVTAIDIDEEAARQAAANVARSPFAQRIEVRRADARTATSATLGCFDAIVANPPYFEEALLPPDKQRTVARHTTMLTYRELAASAWRLLADDGELSVVIPFDCKARLESEALLAGFFKHREWAVKTTPRKPPRRFLLAFRKHGCGLQRDELVIGSESYVELTKDFYSACAGAGHNSQ